MHQCTKMQNHVRVILVHWNFISLFSRSASLARCEKLFTTIFTSSYFYSFHYFSLSLSLFPLCSICVWHLLEAMVRIEYVLICKIISFSLFIICSYVTIVKERMRTPELRGYQKERRIGNEAFLDQFDIFC